jgi:hypothetical protein
MIQLPRPRFFFGCHEDETETSEGLRMTGRQRWLACLSCFDCLRAARFRAILPGLLWTNEVLVVRTGKGALRRINKLFARVRSFSFSMPEEV